MDEGRDEGLIEFEEGGEAVEVEDEGFQVESGIEAEVKLWRKTLRKAEEVLCEGSTRRDADEVARMA